MAKPERPKSRLPDGRINPEYTAWRKANVLNKPKAEPSVVLATAPVVSYVGVESEITVEIGDACPEILALRCVKLARNTTFVYCALGDGIVGVKVKRGIGPKLLKKTIKVRKEGETYVHVP